MQTTTPVRSQGHAIALAVTTLRDAPSTFDEAAKILEGQRKINRLETYQRDQQICLLLISQRETSRRTHLPVWMEEEDVMNPAYQDIVRCVASAHQGMTGRTLPASPPADLGTLSFPFMRVNELALCW